MLLQLQGGRDEVRGLRIIIATITGLEGSFGRKVYDFVFRDIIDNVWNFAKEEEEEQQWEHGGDTGV